MHREAAVTSVAEFDDDDFHSLRGIACGGHTHRQWAQTDRQTDRQTRVVYDFANKNNKTTQIVDCVVLFRNTNGKQKSQNNNSLLNRFRVSSAISVED